MKWLILTLGLLTTGCSISLYSHPVDSPMTVHRSTTVYQQQYQQRRAHYPAASRTKARPKAAATRFTATRFKKAPTQRAVVKKKSSKKRFEKKRLRRVTRR